VSQEINRPGLNQLLTRTLGMKGARAPAGLLTPELAGAIILENDRPEAKVLGGEFIWGCQASYDAGDEVSSIHLLNPADSGVIAIVEHGILASDTTDMCCNVGITLSATATTSGGGFVFPLDARYGSAVAPKLPLLNRFATAQVTQADYQFWHFDSNLARQNVELIRMAVILPPDTALHVEVVHATVTDYHIEYALQGRVRAALPEELLRFR